MVLEGTHEGLQKIADRIAAGKCEFLQPRGDSVTSVRFERPA